MRTDEIGMAPLYPGTELGPTGGVIFPKAFTVESEARPVSPDGAGAVLDIPPGPIGGWSCIAGSVGLAVRVGPAGVDIGGSSLRSTFGSFPPGLALMISCILPMAHC